MYGWRARVGSISATETDIFPYEWYKIVPEGITLFQTTLGIIQVKEKDLNEARDRIEAVALAVAREGADVIITGGAPMVYMQAPGADRALSDQLTQATGVPTICNQTAMMDALRALGCQKILLVTPHDQAINEKLKRFLEGSGFQVVGMGGLDLIVNAEINRITRQQAYHLVRNTFREHRDKGIEGILLQCANWPTSLLASMWEVDLGVPVVTSNLAKIWAVLKTLEIRDVITGFGSLLEQPR